MLKNIKLKENKLLTLLKDIILEQSDTEEYVDITPEQYHKLLNSVGYNSASVIPMLPQFRGKKLRVNGDLKIDGLPITKLGNLTINGKLSFSNSNIKNLDGVKYVTLGGYWGTPYYDVLEKIRLAKRVSDANLRREDFEWNYNNDDISKEGLEANAVFKSLVENGDLDELSYTEREDLKDYERRMEELEERIENEEDSETLDELDGERVELQEEIDDLKIKDNDVYGLIPETQGHYGLSLFTSIHDETEGNTYAVGTFEEADKAIEEYVDNRLEEIDYFDDNTLSYYVNGDEVARYFEDDIREQVYESPSDYGVTLGLSVQQDNEISELEFEGKKLEAELFLINYGIKLPLEYVSNENNDWEFNDGVGNKINLNIESLSDASKNVVLLNGTPTLSNPVYKDVDTEEEEELKDERMSEIDSEIYQIESEIEDIKDDPDGEPDEDEIEDIVSDKMYEIENDPMDYLKEYDMSPKNFIDYDKLKDSMISEIGYGDLSLYDNNYNEIDINGTTYVVIRVE